MTKRALIVIDYQNDYFPGGKWVLPEVGAAAANAAKVIAATRAAGERVIFVRHEFPNADAPLFVAGSEGAKFHESLLPAPGEPVILKHSVNAFRDTDLKARLDAEGIEAVTVIGAMTHMCIHAAARAAADFGYEVTVVEDACPARHLEFQGRRVEAPDVQAAYMSALAWAYATVVSTEELLAAKAAA